MKSPEYRSGAGHPEKNQDAFSLTSYEKLMKTDKKKKNI